MKASDRQSLRELYARGGIRKRGARQGSLIGVNTSTYKMDARDKVNTGTGADMWNTVKMLGAIVDEEAISIGLIVAVCVVVASIALLFVIRSRREVRDSVIMVGLMGAGKTALYTKLRYGHVCETHSSLKTNSALITSSKDSATRKFLLHDIPGHYRLRLLDLDRLAKSARALVFVIDSQQFKNSLADVTAWLYTIVTHSDVSSGKIPIALACNKQDMFGAPSPATISASLLVEMNKIRTTRVSDITLGGNEIFLGSPSKPLTWADLSNPIVVMGCSTLDTDGLLSWIANT
eukprot:CFRG1477T1